MSTDASRFGRTLHAVLEHFEGAALRLRSRGFSDYTADRVGLFTTLCAHGWSVFDAWALVNEQFPPDPLATPHAGTREAPATITAPNPTPEPKGTAHAPR